MKRIIAVFLIVVLFCSFVPEVRTYSEINEDKLVEYLKNLTPEKVREKANEDMKELYGLDNYYPASTKYGPFKVALIQEQINEGFNNRKNL